MENYNTEENNLVAFGGEIKALGDGKIGGYLIRFSDENTPDLVGDFFNAKTQITIPDTLPLLYNPKFRQGEALHCSIGRMLHSRRMIAEGGLICSNLLRLWG